MSRIVNWAAGHQMANTPNPSHHQLKLPGLEAYANHAQPGIPQRSFLRFGDWPKNEQSRNHATGELEDGVSVYELHPHTNEPMDPDPHFEFPGADWSATEKRDRVRRHVTGDHHSQVYARDNKGYEVKGDTGWGFGHDGEPLLRSVQHDRDWDGGAARRHDLWHDRRER